jgi:prepilin-type N-terminal cleavage/methylation domain-containing protein
MDTACRHLICGQRTESRVVCALDIADMHCRMKEKSSSSTFPRLRRSDRGFTLIEVLVVMIILSLLISLGWAGFIGLRTNMMLHQTAITFKAEVVNGQRAAMLLDREIGQAWSYGVVLDLTHFSGSAGDEQTYSISKWCSSAPNYVAFDPVKNLDKDPIIPPRSCDENNIGLFPLEGKAELNLQAGKMNTCVTPSDVSYIVFESVNGRLHFYKSTGEPILPASQSSVTMYFHNGCSGRYTSVTIDVNGRITSSGYDPNVPLPSDCCP